MFLQNNQMSGVVFFEVLGDIFEQNAATKYYKTW